MTALAQDQQITNREPLPRSARAGLISQNTPAAASAIPMIVA